MYTHSRPVVSQCLHCGTSPVHLILWARQAVQARDTLLRSVEGFEWFGRCNRGIATFLLMGPGALKDIVGCLLGQADGLCVEVERDRTHHKAVEKRTLRPLRNECLNYPGRFCCTSNPRCPAFQEGRGDGDPFHLDAHWPWDLTRLTNHMSVVASRPGANQNGVCSTSLYLSHTSVQARNKLTENGRWHRGSQRRDRQYHCVDPQASWERGSAQVSWTPARLIAI